jgi:hypothetical protein
MAFSRQGTRLAGRALERSSDMEYKTDMTTTGATIDLDKAKLDPAAVFDAPKDVLRAPGLSAEDKRAILSRWEQDAEALLRATEEGMEPADNRSPAELLRVLHEAIHTLEDCYC